MATESAPKIRGDPAGIRSEPDPIRDGQIRQSANRMATTHQIHELAETFALAGGTRLTQQLQWLPAMHADPRRDGGGWRSATPGGSEWLWTAADGAARHPAPARRAAPSILGLRAQPQAHPEPAERGAQAKGKG